MFVAQSNKMFIVVFEDRIRENRGGGHGNVRKEVFHCLLHEMSHALIVLKMWRESSGKTLEQVSDEDNAKMESHYCGEMSLEKWLKNPVEVLCERFALKNLSYLSLLYKYDGLLASTGQLGAVLPAKRTSRLVATPRKLRRKVSSVALSKT
jgi:hypothetical protein